MRVRKLSSTGDYSFGSGLLDFYIDLPDGVAQNVRTRLLLFLGEWFLDIEEGTFYFQGILGKKTKQSADATIQDRVLSTFGVVGIENYESTINEETRALSVSFDLNTIYGQTSIQVENYKNF